MCICVHVYVSKYFNGMAIIYKKVLVQGDGLSERSESEAEIYVESEVTWTPTQLTSHM